MIDMTAPVYCANHPGVETTLRCNRCGKPICAKCAVRTPTGYRCKECVRGQQKIFITAEWVDYLLGFITAGLLSLVGSLLVGLISGIGLFAFLIIFFGASTAGMIIAEAARRVTRKHRAPSLFITVAVAVALGALPMILVNLFSMSIFGLIFQGIYVFIVVPLVYTRLSGLQITR